MSTQPDARTALATRRDQQDQQVAERPPENSHMVPAGAETSRLVLWAYEARQAHLIATSLAKTSFVPSSMRGKPEEIAAAILTGAELDLPIMAALRSIDVINGTPGFRAHMIRGMVQSRGHKIWLVEQSDTRVVMRGQRREADGTYGPEQEVVWDTARATKLKLIGKDEWLKQPATMLTNRATAEMGRLVAADALFGIAYTIDELEDDVAPASPVSAAAVALAQRAEKARPVEDAAVVEPDPPAQPEPPAESWPKPAEVPTADPPDVQTGPKLATDAQIRGIHAGRNKIEEFSGNSAEAKELFLVHVATLLNPPREVKTLKELTVSEASDVIEDLIERRKRQDLGPVPGETTPAAKPTSGTMTTRQAMQTLGERESATAEEAGF